MTGDTTNLVLEHLGKIRFSLDRLEGDVGDLKLRMSAVEQQLGHLQLQIAGQNGRIERVEERLGRIDRRLDLAVTH